MGRLSSCPVWSHGERVGIATLEVGGSSPPAPVRSVASEDVAQRTAKAWDDVLAVQFLVRSHDGRGSVRTVDARETPDGIQHPDEPDARVEPLTHLLQHLARPVAR